MPDVTAPNVGLRELAKSERMMKIHAAAAELMRERDFQSITTKDIATKARVGEATLFRYVGSKHELLTIVYGGELDLVLDRIDEEDRIARASFPASPSPRSFVDRVLNAYRLRCDFYRVAPNNAALYLREGFEAGGDISARHVAQGDRTIGLVAAILAEASELGLMIEGFDVQLVAQNCHGTYMHEVDRTPVRGYAPDSIWSRLRPRLEVQILPLFAR